MSSILERYSQTAHSALKPTKTWHHEHMDKRTTGERVADNVAAFVGSWKFIFIQVALMALWVAGNIYLIFHFDPFPFVFLNLFMSAEAAFSTPIIMMSQNRQSESSRHQADADFKTNVEAKKEIEALQLQIARLENEKHEEIIKMVKLMNTTFSAALTMITVEVRDLKKPVRKAIKRRK